MASVSDTRNEDEMNAAEMRAWLKDVPDDAVIVADPGDGSWWELNIDEKFDREGGDLPPVAVLVEGMEVTLQYEADRRKGIDD